jgi:hypothetical protein
MRIFWICVCIIFIVLIGFHLLRGLIYLIAIISLSLFLYECVKFINGGSE